MMINDDVNSITDGQQFDSHFKPNDNPMSCHSGKGLDEMVSGLFPLGDPHPLLPMDDTTFKYSLAPHTFNKCLETALEPLCHQGIGILFYLDDIQICQSVRGKRSVPSSVMSDLNDWRLPEILSRGVPMGSIVTSFMDASLIGWVGTCHANSTGGKWSLPSLHINVLESKTVGPKTFHKSGERRTCASHQQLT